MGIFIFLILLGLFIYGVIISNRKNLSSVPPTIALFLMLFQLLSILGDIDLTYYGLGIDEFNSNTAFYIAFIFYYIGYFIWSIIALLLVYIPIIFNKNKQ